MFISIPFHDYVARKVVPFSHQRPVMLSPNEPSFDGIRHVIEREILAVEVTEVIVSRSVIEHDRKRPGLLISIDASSVAGLFEQAQLAIEVV